VNGYFLHVKKKTIPIHEVPMLLQRHTAYEEKLFASMLYIDGATQWVWLSVNSLMYAYIFITSLGVKLWWIVPRHTGKKG